MFELAGGGVYNNFSSDKYCTLQKVLQAKAVAVEAGEQIGNLFSERMFQRLTYF